MRREEASQQALEGFEAEYVSMRVRGEPGSSYARHSRRFENLGSVTGDIYRAN